MSEDTPRLPPGESTAKGIFGVPSQIGLQRLHAQKGGCIAQAALCQASVGMQNRHGLPDEIPGTPGC